ncbi:MAG: hypothetical protein KDB14_03615 [Planctomycetales bacterium]|nr:hypothetical protein [Planctomycetales bacterium]
MPAIDSILNHLPQLPHRPGRRERSAPRALSVVPPPWLARLATLALAVVVAAVVGAVASASVDAAELPDLATVMPATIEQCTAERAKQCAAACAGCENWFAEQMLRLEEIEVEQVTPLLVGMIQLDKQLGDAMSKLLELRTQFRDSPQHDPSRDTVRRFLTLCTDLIGLNGRLHYQQRDAIDVATYRLASDPPRLGALIDALAERQSVAAAAMFTFVLLDPPAESGLKPYPPELRAKVLRLISAARSLESTPLLVDFIEQRSTDPGLRLSAIEVLRHIGIPQDPHPLQDPTITAPIITAGKLLRIAESTRLPAGSPAEALQRREALIGWLRERVAKGVSGDSYRVGPLEVREGDWFLMRNPSPFNQFTDLAPGLFTHVGVVTTLTDEQGVRRFVVTDVPERGDRVPATNVDAYVGTTLHYFFLRHRDEQVNQTIAEAARQTIGNPTQFDLLFRTGPVEKLKGQDLRGKTIHTYCAGFLLLCAQQTGLPRADFFPLREFSPSERCQQNLAKLGLRLGDDYISPTGPLFSPNHVIVGGRRPLYSPEREIQTAIFDHFGYSMAHGELVPSPDLFQMLRSKVAGLSRYNPWLARAIAQANNVSPKIDLESAARAAAVIETLDEIANQARDDYRLARQVLISTDEDLADLPADDFAKLGAFRKRHADLDKKIAAGQMTPRDLRIALVRFYQQQGREALNARFFPSQTAGR